jgi:hypothetical protein
MQVLARKNLKGALPGAGVVTVPPTAVITADGNIHFDCLFAIWARFRLIRRRMAMQNPCASSMGLLHKAGCQSGGP